MAETLIWPAMDLKKIRDQWFAKYARPHAGRVALPPDQTDLVNELTTRRDELISVIAGQQAHIARLDARVKTLEARVKLLRPRPRPRT